MTIAAFIIFISDFIGYVLVVLLLCYVMLFPT